ncbi:conserved hypothetical protein [Perkinsus marinus ATCC 50983]|uniref:GTP-eEF1A C-terminal domain-containing protein n=1 Tax=Perkinsus marinus (strain ATCC 50983 / TXsc) TaxID=423536 RepID=C5K9H3_PERM5|nr:conserved hypothetical protein [Perkinsus marinus ATCC 50983]EER18745.1 conserved hypothetical protein [Perkinsus marinus ATCC 50983]|eukprot:XP_002786949.1 conserved hypothetical protein [Perkinsus marinus ATCC 50983]
MVLARPVVLENLEASRLSPNLLQSIRLTWQRYLSIHHCLDNLTRIRSPPAVPFYYVRELLLDIRHQIRSNPSDVQILDVPGELKVGYSPIAFVRTGRSACKLTKINWKVGKETGGKKMEDPHSLKSNEMAEVVFEPLQHLVVDTFKHCEGLSRVALMEGNGVVMLGKCVATTPKEVK